MKRILLSLSFLIALSLGVSAQCTPGANYADSTYGVWPDTIQNFPMAMQDVAYVTDLNFKVPSNAGDVDPNYDGYVIDHFVVDNVIGLPTGMNYACNISNCTYAGGANGCAQITGTCATPGVYNIQIDITVTVIFLSQPVEVERSFTGYKIEVGTAGIITLLQKDINFAPNPASNEVSMSGLYSAGIESVSIFNTNGQLVKSMETNSYDKIDVNVSDLTEGIYMVHLEGINGTLVKKFIKN